MFKSFNLMPRPEGEGDSGGGIDNDAIGSGMSDVDYLNDEGSDESEESSSTEESETEEDDSETGESEESSSDEQDDSLEEDDQEEKPEGEEDKDEEFEAEGLPNFKEIKKAFPDFFKKFPQVGAAYRDYKRFIQIVPTVEALRETKDKSEVLDMLSSDLTEGKLESFFQANKDQNSLGNFAKNVLPSLYKFDKESFNKAVTPVFRNLVNLLHKETKTTGDKNWSAAGKLISKLLWGSYELPEEEDEETAKTDPKLEEEKTKFEQERANYRRERAQNFAAAIDRDVDTRVQKIFDKSFPRNFQGPQGVKKYILKEVQAEYNSILSKDPRHMAIAKKLFASAYQDNYSEALRAKLVSQFMHKAEYLFPKLIKKHIAELNGNGSSDRYKPIGDKKPDPNRNRVTNNLNKDGNKKENKDKDPRKTMSAREFLEK